MANGHTPERSSGKRVSAERPKADLPTPISRRAFPALRGSGPAQPSSASLKSLFKLNF